MLNEAGTVAGARPLSPKGALFAAAVGVDWRLLPIGRARAAIGPEVGVGLGTVDHGVQLVKVAFGPGVVDVDVVEIPDRIANTLLLRNSSGAAAHQLGRAKVALSPELDRLRPVATGHRLGARSGHQ